MGTVRVGMNEADGYSLDPMGLDGRHKRADAILVQRDQNIAVEVQPLPHMPPEITWHQRLGAVDVDVVLLKPASLAPSRRYPAGLRW